MSSEAPLPSELPTSQSGAAPSAGSPAAHVSPAQKPVRRRLWKRLALGALILAPLSIGLLWYLVHTIPWMGPLVANSLRATIGVDNVAKLEDFAYAVEDRINQRLKGSDAPKSYWKVPPKTAQAPAPAPSTTAEVPGVLPAEPPFSLKDLGPLHDGLSAEGDGVWVPMPDPHRPDEAPHLLKTLIHPDKSRGWAELFVVAVDLRHVTVKLMAGYQEPRTENPDAATYQRPAKIPPTDYDRLLGAFNGGFMAEHGHYGFLLDGILFLEPRDDSCTLAHYRDGTYEIATWTKIAGKKGEMDWFRQGPLCMVENNELDPSLRGGHNKKFGATLDGNTVIRRSAVGISHDRNVLFVGITNHTTAKALAVGMKHAGAEVVAQMDVNWSYPKFVTYEPKAEGQLFPIALADGFEFSDALYLRERAMRDFFYLVRNDLKPESAPKVP